MNSKNYVFDFTIPQGPTGPTGPAYGLNAYGARFSIADQTLNLQPNVKTIIPLYANSISHMIDYDTENSITIFNDGIYDIVYNLDIAVTNNAKVTVLVNENNQEIVPTESSKSLIASRSTYYSQEAIYSLNGDSTLNLIIESDTATQVFINKNAHLIVKQLD